MLYRIVLDYACFGVKTEGDVVTVIAPIWQFAIGWNIEKLKKYVEQKRGEIEVIK